MEMDIRNGNKKDHYVSIDMMDLYPLKQDGDSSDISVTKTLTRKKNKNKVKQWKKKTNQNQTMKKQNQTMKKQTTSSLKGSFSLFDNTFIKWMFEKYFDPSTLVTFKRFNSFFKKVCDEIFRNDLEQNKYRELVNCCNYRKYHSKVSQVPGVTHYGGWDFDFEHSLYQPSGGILTQKCYWCIRCDQSEVKTVMVQMENISYSLTFHGLI
jgi:hypothetical protein